MLALLEKKSRLLIFYVATGMVTCIISAEINTFLKESLSLTVTYFVTNISPVTEEIIKLVPVLIHAMFVSRKRDELIGVSIAVGVGFSVLENIVYITADAKALLADAVLRGFTGGLGHGLFTLISGYGLSFAGSKKRYFLPGTVALINTSAVMHSVHNTLVMKNHYISALAILVLIYVFILYLRYGVSTNKEKTI